MPFLRRVHPAPEPTKLKAFAEFARILGYKMKSETDRFTLQRILEQSADKPDAYAVHYALLRSLKQATYSPERGRPLRPGQRELLPFHVADSPLSRPDGASPARPLAAHRPCGSDARRSWRRWASHCSKTERRAEMAERELVKLKLLTYLSERIGLELEAIITGVADYGFFGQAETLPVEGLVHVSTLPDDYYYFDEPLAQPDRPADANGVIGSATR